MRTGTGEEPTEYRGDEAPWFNGLHSLRRGRDGDGSIAQTEDISDGTWSTNTGNGGDVTKAPWLTQVSDFVNHPAHYTTNGTIECIDAIDSQLTADEYRGYLKGCIAKYIWRERYKGGIESLKKAQWYLNRLIEFDETQKG